MRGLIPATVIAFVCLTCCVLRAQDHEEKPPIRGEITIDKAMNWLYGDAYDAGKRSATRDGTVVSALTTQTGEIDGKAHWFLYLSSADEGRNCHACQASLEFVAFARNDEGWVKVARGGTGSTGAYGQVGYFKTVQLGKSCYGMILNTGWFGQGVLYGHQSLFGFKDGSFQSIASFPTGFNNEGSMANKWEKLNWEVKWSFVTSGSSNGLYDIQMNWVHVPKEAFGKLGKDSGAATPPAKGLYRYDGTAYRHVKTGEVLGSAGKAQ